MTVLISVIISRISSKMLHIKLWNKFQRLLKLVHRLIRNPLLRTAELPHSNIDLD